MAKLVCLDLGRAAYQQTLELQRRLAEELLAAEEERAYLVLAEHEPPVITLGRRAQLRHVLATPEALAAAGVELHQAQRGGDVTWHGPGQLVAYPILRIDLHGRDVRRYVRDLEQAVIELLRRMGLPGRRQGRLTGVWVGPDKVAAIGVAVRRWVSQHGLALNVSADLSGFELIVPCGIPGRAVTSLSRLLGREVPVSEVKPVLIECMVETFGLEGAILRQPEGE